MHNYEISAAAATGIRRNEYCTDLLKNLKKRSSISRSGPAEIKHYQALRTRRVGVAMTITFILFWVIEVSIHGSWS
jgi:hypothetical protein